MNGATPPYELQIIRIAQRYNKLPYEVLSESPEWFDLMILVENLDLEKQVLDKRRSDFNKKKNG